MGKKLKYGNSEVTPMQEAFCKLFATEPEFFGNGTQSYISAYGVDVNQKGAYLRARVEAHNLLTKPNILQRINELLEEIGLNDSNIDKQLFLVVNQNADLSAKIQAIREYNKLKGRIKDENPLKDLLTGVSITINKNYGKNG
ncbi:MAG: terminase small subunit [Sulfurimonas sp.]|jgi:hypothetical protein